MLPRSLPLLLVFLICQSAAAEIEPWADAKLPVREGLELWLDAARQSEARAARKLPALTSNSAIDIWLDGSSRGRHVVQRVADAQPEWQQTPGGAFVRFDGQEDWLGAANLGASLEAATVFAVAAPRTNAGYFRGFISWTETSHNDYRTGLNLDLGADGTPTFSVLNAEGAGFTGIRNLLKTQLDFGTFHVFALTCAPGKAGVRLFLDGSPQGTRDRTPSTLRMDELAVGARILSNSAEAPFAQCNLDGDIAEVLIYSRALPDEERAQVEQYLLAKHSGLKPIVGAKPLMPVKNPPPVQMLVPGFTARALPVELTNIVCLRYRADGTLVAGAYNGKIWLLRDSDGDGLEDKADLYWQSEDLKGVIGMTLTLPNDPRGEGVFVATKERILFIPDKDRDGRGDESRVVATGWPKQAFGSGGGGIVEALGLTMDKDGNLFFGLGCDAFANPYVIDDKTGHSRYRIESERGTIQRVSADFSKRETVCTGIRYPMGAAFNSLGDLFVTDQEGATWLPNGNPFDELLHIQPGRHYGFPPQHPKHLPKVLDEPSVFDYGPQHQSTCGFLFNEGAATFGPAWWKGDAIVTGESRGKLWRTKLVKTAAGYVAQNQLIAALGMLAVDVALSPRGDLAVACHSGGPDWGTGPEGPGSIFSLRYNEPGAPQPVLTWSASPTEIRVAFDRQLEPTKLGDLVNRVKLEQGAHVSAGDRFESIRPGYQVVKDQMAAPRFEVPLAGAVMMRDQRSIVLMTPPRTVAIPCAITLPDFTSRPTVILSAAEGPGATARKHPAKEPSPRHPQIDLATDLSGVAAEWKTAVGDAVWHGWLPHLDLGVARALTAASAEHAWLFTALEKPDITAVRALMNASGDTNRFLVLSNKPGELRLRGQLDLWQMLQPAIQPGSTLDYERPVEGVMVRFECNAPFTIQRQRAEQSQSPAPGARHCFEIRAEGRPGAWVPFDVTLPTGAGIPEFTVSWSTADDRRARAFPLRRVLLPWAKAKADDAPAAEERQIPELAGGRWLAGRKLFFGKATCGNCHRAGGEGGIAGPDLSNLVHRDYASVVRDIREPSAALNPDHLAYNIALKGGTAIAGLVLGEERGELRYADATGAVKTVARANIESQTPLPISLMPPGLLDALAPAEQRDLLTFLLVPGLEPAKIEAPNPPPARKRTEVEALVKQLAGNTAAPDAKPFRIVLCDDPKDHGPGEHDYPLYQKRWAQLLGMAEGVTVGTARTWPSDEQWRAANLVVFISNNQGWNAARAPQLDAFLARGGGLAYFHWAIDGHKDGDLLAERLGLAVRSSMTKFRHGPLDLAFTEHPLAAGLPTLHLEDESYWGLIGDPSRVHLLASAVEDGAPRPQMWTREHGGGRIFVSIPGHYSWTYDDPFFRALAFRGLCWAAHQPIDRLAELIPIGARISE